MRIATAARRPKAVFVSYRRTDGELCALICHELSHNGVPINVFRDMDAVPVGVDFQAVVREELLAADAVVAIIGKKWLRATTQCSERDAPVDYVQQEIELAQRHGIPIVVVCLDGASLPIGDAIPSWCMALRDSPTVQWSSKSPASECAKMLVQHIESLASSVGGHANAYEQGALYAARCFRGAVIGVIGGALISIATAVNDVVTNAPWGGMAAVAIFVVGACICGIVVGWIRLRVVGLVIGAVSFPIIVGVLSTGLFTVILAAPMSIWAWLAARQDTEAENMATGSCLYGGICGVLILLYQRHRISERHALRRRARATILRTLCLTLIIALLAGGGVALSAMVMHLSKYHTQFFLVSVGTLLGCSCGLLVGALASWRRVELRGRHG